VLELFTANATAAGGVCQE